MTSTRSWLSGASDPTLTVMPRDARRSRNPPTPDQSKRMPSRVSSGRSADPVIHRAGVLASPMISDVMPWRM